jgi:hypothetical protein
MLGIRIGIKITMQNALPFSVENIFSVFINRPKSAVTKLSS